MDIELICLESTESLKNDIYLQKEYKKISHAVRTLFGIIDSNFNKHLSNHTNKTISVSYFISIFHNLFIRSGLYDCERELFISTMTQIYDKYHDSQKSIDTYILTEDSIIRSRLTGMIKR